MTTYKLKFTHPLAELCALKGFCQRELYPLLYNYVGTHVIHDKSEYSDPNRYDEIRTKVDEFIFNTIPLLSILKPHYPSNELIYDVVKCRFFGNGDYSFVTPTELREELESFITNTKRVNDEYHKAAIASYLQTDLNTSEQFNYNRE